MSPVAEVVPLKQGLKLLGFKFFSKPSSGCRGSSIKTRIETWYRHKFLRCRKLVAEVVPLKQGLKLTYVGNNAYISIYVAEVVPLKQGLKQKVLTW